jgi:aspartate aminotransferase/aminotransferase
MAGYIADRVKAIDASGIRKVFALAAKMKDPVNFSIGQPDFDVPEKIKDAAIEAIRKGQNRYSQTPGIDELKACIVETTKSELGWSETVPLVTSGVSGALQLLFMATINPGDEVIMADPYFVMYKQLVKMLDGKCVFVDTYPDFKFTAEKIEKAITSKTKLILLNSPANPTGVVYTEDEVKAIAKVAKKHDVLVMSDEIYDKFSYDAVPASIAKYYDKTVLLKGFSKSYAMTGWRLGYVAVKPVLDELIEQMAKLQQYTFVCAPTPFQFAAVEAMDFDISHYVGQYKIKRDMIYNGLKDKFEVVKPGGAFYIFVKAPGGDATAFVKKAIENNVLIIPGSVFSEKDTHFRISYATTNEKIQKGIEILKSIA